MRVGGSELNEFKVKPWMELEPFDPKLIKKISHNHPYKILLYALYKHYPSYNTGKRNDTELGGDGDEDVTDFYFRMLDDYNRYGIAFERDFELLPDNKLGVFEYEKYGKPHYYLVKNWLDK